jgi:iron-sulfur cluster assembly accessory protein
MLLVSNFWRYEVVTITDKAAEKATAILAAEGKDNWGLRIYSSEGGCCGPSYGLDIDERPSADDEVIEKNGLMVFVDKNTLPALTGMQLDYYDDGEREGFILSGGAGPSGSACSSGCSSCG